MPIKKSKPSSTKTGQRPPKSAKSELGDDELRSITGGMASTGGTDGTKPPVCVSQT